MENVMVKSKNVDDAFMQWYDILSNMGIKQDSRDGEVVGEVINAITVIEDPTRCIMSNPIRKITMR